MCDDVQETFLILLVSAGSIRDPNRLGPWLWTTASNLARRTARRNIRAAGRSRTSRLASPRSRRVRRGGAGLDRGAPVRGAARGDGVDHVRRSASRSTCSLVEDRPCYATISYGDGRAVGSLGLTPALRILSKLRAHPAMARVAVAA